VNLLDVLLVLAALAFAGSGYQRGLVVALTSTAGFVGGVLVGLWALPIAVGYLDFPRMLVALIVVLVPALAGEVIGSQIGWAIRRRLTFAPARWADGIGGALANIVAVLLVAWLAGGALANSPSPGLNREIRDSRVLAAVDDVMPQQADAWFGQAASALTEAGFPQVFNPFETEPPLDLPPPTTGAIDASGARRAALQSVVRVQGAAPACGRLQTGSGFVYAPGRVMTNAHVVSGVPEPTVQVGGTGEVYDATVVFFDPDTDVAVLAVPDLDAPALAFSDDAGRGDHAIVAGFPEGGGLDLQSAVVGRRLSANGQDIYGESLVTRDIYAIRSYVRSGNSGGPLLTPDGEVYGVVFARSVTDPGVGYVLTADEVADEAREGRTDTSPVEPTRCSP